MQIIVTHYTNSGQKGLVLGENSATVLLHGIFLEHLGTFGVDPTWLWKTHKSFETEVIQELEFG